LGYDPFFIALGLLDLVAAAVLWTVVRPPEAVVVQSPELVEKPS